MAESAKGPKDGSRTDGSRVLKTVPKTDKPPGETAKATDSVPMAGGPFTVLPMKFGRYQILKELGRGQMGAVYLAQDTELDRPVALKVARTSSSGSAKLLKRMEVEAKAAAVVDHPLICKVYDAGEINGIRFIALQYVEGEDLKKFLKRTGRRLDPKEVVRIVVQILRALQAAHEKGIIHRDLKPDNVMLNKNSEPVIMDFGLARRNIGSSDAGLTQGMVVGTAAYMSPEQAVGKADGIDHRSDIYAVGVMLFEMLTGAWPFTGGAIEVMGKKCVQPPPSPLTLNPDLPSELAAVCHKMIAQRKEDRYSTSAEVIKSLEAVELIYSAEESASTIAPELEPVFDFQPTAAVSSQRRKKSKVLGEKQTTAKSPSGLFAKLANWWNRRPPALRWSMLGGGAALLVALAAIIFLPTPYGLLQIEINDPTLNVQFDGSVITVAKSGQIVRVSPTTKHTLEVIHDGITVDSLTREITLKKGEKQIVKVTLVDGNLIVGVNGTPVATATIAPRQNHAPIDKEIPKADPVANGGKQPIRPNAPPQIKPAVVNDLPVIHSKSTGMTLALIPAGKFLMGSPGFEPERNSNEGPQHLVEITRPFYMGIYEVTQTAYESVIGLNPSHFSHSGSGRERIGKQDTRLFPVEYVSWYDAVEFCNKLSEKEELSPCYLLTNVKRENDLIKSADVALSGGNGYRLPTEAEWEYACRGTTTTPFHFGGTLNGDLANVDGTDPYGTTGKGAFLSQTTEVGHYPKNEFGLFDMHGNVSEWCFDSYDEAAYGRPSGIMVADPITSNGGPNRLARGGNWNFVAASSRSAFREIRWPDFRFNFTGFRVIRSYSPEEAAATTTTKQTLPAAIHVAEAGDEFFNGKDLTGWDGRPGYWHVENGSLVGRCPPGRAAHTFLISKKLYTDIELEFRVHRQNGVGNSGVQFRSWITDFEKLTMSGPQCEIDSSDYKFPPGSLLTEPTAHPLAEKARPEVSREYSNATFNHFHIRCVAKRVTIKVNGIVAIDGEYPSLPETGHIGWQIHGKSTASEITFKDIRFTDLTDRTQRTANADEPLAGNLHSQKSKFDATPSSQSVTAPVSKSSESLKEIEIIVRQYEDTCNAAGGKLIEAFDKQIGILQTNSKLQADEKKKQIGIIQTEKATFERHRTIPFSPAMRSDAINFLSDLSQAENSALSAIGSLSIAKADLAQNKKLIVPKVVGRWKLTGIGNKHNFSMTLYSNGDLAYDNVHRGQTWHLDSNEMVGRNGKFIDKCVIEQNGQEIILTNNVGARFKGVRSDPR